MHGVSISFGYNCLFFSMRWVERIVSTIKGNPRNKVCSVEKYTKHSSVLLLRLVYFSAEQTLIWNSKYRNRILCISRLYLIYKKPGHNPFFLISLVRSSKNEFLTFEYNLKLKMQKSNTIDIADLLLQKAFSHTFFLIH